MDLAEALRAARAARRPAIVPYLMVDRTQSRRLSARVRALRDGGATALELGFPFSDPIADGPVLATSAQRALDHGTRWADLLAACRTASQILPVAVMTYANPVWRHGLPKALEGLRAAGASGLIVPDLSLEESRPWRTAAARARVHLVLLAAPGVSRPRLARIARASRGFLYLVGRYGITGASVRGTSVALAPILRQARSAAPTLPILVGFGIRDRAGVARAFAAGADGVIVATALKERLDAGASPDSIRSWLHSLASTRSQPSAVA